jgi:transcriptional regulator with PAS, ATPase and Fis domain
MLAEGLVLTERDLHAALPLESGVDRPERPPSDIGQDDRTLTQDLHLVERNHIVRVLAEAHGNKRAAAERLGLSRRTLYRRLERYHLLEDSETRH